MNLIDCEYRVLFVWGWAYLGTCSFSNSGTLTVGRELAGGKGKTDSNFSTCKLQNNRDRDIFQ